MREHNRLNGFIELRDRRIKIASSERMEDKVHADAGVILEGGIAHPFMQVSYVRIVAYLFEEWNPIKHNGFSGGTGPRNIG